MAKQARVVTVLWVLAGLLLVSCLAFAQDSRKTQSAEIRGDSSVFNWIKNELVLTGNVSVQVTSPNATTFTAPKMTAKFSKAMDQILTLVATGPVRVEITTAPDADGVRSRITATGNDKAEYSETTQKIKLLGDAVADYVSLPEGPESRRMHFTGEEIEADLNTSLLTVRKPHISFSTPLKPPAETPAPGAPAPAPGAPPAP